MANICTFSLRFKGNKDTLEELKNLFEENNYDKPHFYRISEFDGEIIGHENGEFELSGMGNCAWSLDACTSMSGYFHTDMEETLGASRGTCIENFASQHTDLIGSMISEEPGMAFSEYISVGNGVVNREVGDFEEKEVDGEWVTVLHPRWMTTDGEGYAVHLHMNLFQ